eukprot:m.138272 g.138272  ORF g.138272 m.138272 type:complete len:156 (-) comp20259_c0_seq2:53-520(-)
MSACAVLRRSIHAWPGARSLLFPRTVQRRPAARLFSTQPQPPKGMLQRWLAPGPEHARFSAGWWADWTVKFVVFGITGSSSVYFVRPLLSSVFGLEGTMVDGPWSYRIASVLFVTPVYSVILIVVGTLFGKHAFFLGQVRKIWARLLPGLRPRKT